MGRKTTVGSNNWSQELTEDHAVCRKEDILKGISEGRKILSDGQGRKETVSKESIVTPRTGVGKKERQSKDTYKSLTRGEPLTQKSPHRKKGGEKTRKPLGKKIETVA